MRRYHPRIYRGRYTWYCQGDGCTGEGYDAAHAYSEWWAIVRRSWNTVAAADSAAQL